MSDRLQNGVELRHQLYNDERVRRLVTKKQRYVFLLSILVLLIYCGFVLTMAFMPELLSARIINGVVEIHGLLICLTLYITIYIVMVIFAWRQIIENNSDIHKLVETIRNE